MTRVTGTVQRRRRGGHLIRTEAALLAAVVLSLGAVFVVHRWVADSWGPLAELDRVVLAELHDVAAGSPWLVVACKVLSRVGTPVVYQVMAAAVAAWLVWRRRPVAALYAAVTTVIGLQLAPLVKGVVRRSRPELFDAVAGAGGYSFPSGHALSVTVVALTLVAVVVPVLPTGRRRAAVTAAALTVVAMGTARLVLGVHYLSDVLAGVLLGVAWVGTMTAILLPLLRREVGDG